MNADQRLVAYGTLAPGGPNHHQLADIAGRWFDGIARGELVNEGWGAELGYPALILNAAGPPIDVQVFESADLPAHWSRLDEFEGPGYERVVTSVDTARGPVEAFVYVARRS